MTVEDIIAEIKILSPADRRRVKLALEAVGGTVTKAEADPAAAERGEAAWDRLLQGFGTAGGKHLSANIDEALYGGER